MNPPIEQRIEHGFALVNGCLEELFTREEDARYRRLKLATIHAKHLPGGFLEALNRLKIEPATWRN